MSKYTNFIGIDIGKFNFVAALYGSSQTYEFENNSSGIAKFLKQFKPYLSESLVVLETTGGYEMKVLLTLSKKSISVHRANTRKVKNFIRSFGSAAKTDHLDAQALALYGKERGESVDLFTPMSKSLVNLCELVQRRKDLKQMLVAEKNRLQAPKVSLVKDSCQVIIKALTEQIEQVTKRIKELISADSIFSARVKALKTIPGIGDVIAQDLVALMPELGLMDRRRAASLAGLAPIANDSGRFSGYRRTGHGRKDLKPALFLAAMAARNSNSNLKVFYEKLIARGKNKMVALTALMRKIIVIANAILKKITFPQQHS